MAELTKQQKLATLDELRIEAERLHRKFLSDLQVWTVEFVTWLKASEFAIETIFGSNSNALASFKGIYFIPPPWQTFANEDDRTKAQLAWFESGVRFAQFTLLGLRYSVERLSPDDPPRGTPFIFISHGGSAMDHVHLTRDFLTALGLAPIIVRDQPNMGLSINEKVRHCLALCTAAVVLATAEDETLSGERRARPNVENEIGMLQTAPNIGARVIYLKEREVCVPSNYAEKGWISFDAARVQDVFIDIARELRAYGFLG